MAYGSDPAHPQPYTEEEPLRATLTYGVHKRQAEAEIAASGLDAVIVRSAAVLGRGVRNVVSDVFATPSLIGSTEGETLWQLVHQEDVVRFLADAATGTRTGTVNLAADDVIPLDEVGQLLRKRVMRLSPRRLSAMATALWALHLSDVEPAGVDALTAMPLADTARLRREWDFECAWTTRETFADARRSLRNYMVVGPRSVERRTVLPLPAPGFVRPVSWPDGVVPQPAASPELVGELDDMVDPALADWTATNVAEAFPGPMTPLSLEVARRGLLAGGEAVADVLALPPDVDIATRLRIIGVFGHRIYLNVALARETAKVLPGSSPEEIDRQYCGIPLPEGHRPRMTLPKAQAGIRTMRKGGLVLAGFERDVAAIEEEAGRLHLNQDELEATSDVALDARLRLAFDTTIDSHAVNVIAAMLAGGAVAALERGGGDDAVAAATAGPTLRSAGPLAGVEQAAAIVRGDAGARAALAERHRPDALQHLAASAPLLQAAVQALLREHGHRGPGELELANDVFADRPALLLDAIAAAADSSPRLVRDASGRMTRKQRGAVRALLRRERARDASVRIVHELRRTVREKARRMAASGVLTDPGQAWYLLLDELLRPPEDAVAVATARQAERARLAALELPAFFSVRWQPEGDVDGALPGQELQGIGASAGVAKGPVRLLVDPHAADVHAGEVLVAHVTDVGYTPLFACAAAVVTDVGGLMSHAAVVAREFGIPAAVSVGGATKRLADGQVVVVDGSAGTVTVVE